MAKGLANVSDIIRVSLIIMRTHAPILLISYKMVVEMVSAER